MGITVLKHNAPWGPFSRAQIEEGLARGDYNLQYLAYAPGLEEWLPLGEVLDYVDRTAKLPPVPDSRGITPPPAIPDRPTAPPVLPAPPGPPTLPETSVKVSPLGFRHLERSRAKSKDQFSTSEKGQAELILRQAQDDSLLGEPILRGTLPVPPALPVSPALEKPEVRFTPAPFFLRGIAFLIDCAILFVPVAILFILGALAIEIPGAWQHIDHESRMQEWALLERNSSRLAWLVAVGFGWLYGAGLESSPSQATVGKRWMGIKVTDARGGRLGFLHATGRYAAKYLSALPCFLGFIAALFSPRGLALHDRLSGTRVAQR